MLLSGLRKSSPPPALVSVLNPDCPGLRVAEVPQPPLQTLGPNAFDRPDEGRVREPERRREDERRDELKLNSEGVLDPETGREAVPFIEGGGRRPLLRCRIAELEEELSRWKVEGRVPARGRLLSPGGDARRESVSCTVESGGSGAKIWEGGREGESDGERKGTPFSDC